VRIFFTAIEEWMVRQGMLHDEDRHPEWREYQRSLEPDD
jgi:hypothetical protein